MDQTFWKDDHFEGGYLFRDSVVIEMTPPRKDGKDWHINYDLQSDNTGRTISELQPRSLDNGKLELLIPFQSDTTPGVSGNVRFVVSAWNA